jgi:streptomycin 6-kinase
VESRPFETTAIGGYASKSAWDAAAAELVGVMLARWHLTALEPLAGGEAGAVLRVRTSTGEPAVLKVGYPHVEGVHEAVALEHWGPVLAPRVLRQDPWTWAMLLEELVPGTQLGRAPLPAEDALRIATDLYARMSQVAAAPGLPPLADLMLPFVETAERMLAEFGLGGQHSLVADGLREYRRLIDSSGEQRMLHGDFNPGNVVASGSGWRVLDPKPMLGDPAFDLPPMVDQVGPVWLSPDPATAVSERMTRMSSALSLDPSRAARWGFARAALDATWYAEDGEHDAVALALRRAAGWRSVSGA